MAHLGINLSTCHHFFNYCEAGISTVGGQYPIEVFSCFLVAALFTPNLEIFKHVSSLTINSKTQIGRVYAIVRLFVCVFLIVIKSWNTIRFGGCNNVQPDRAAVLSFLSVIPMICWELAPNFSTPVQKVLATTGSAKKKKYRTNKRPIEIKFPD